MKFKQRYIGKAYKVFRCVAVEKARGISKNATWSEKYLTLKTRDACSPYDQASSVVLVRVYLVCFRGIVQQIRIP